MENIKSILTPDDKTEAIFDAKAQMANILGIAEQLDKDTIALIVGDDEWEINEFDAKLDARFQNNPPDQETLIKMLDVVSKIQAAQASDDVNKSEVIKLLGQEFEQL